ncbi:hypothetical protein ACFOZ5_11375 [Marinobacter lacisalsi]|uniref:Uncharacterized protein n=1 Tax=Marinobacter lacisalsi TaxID=475979 RepID=A0ABV8QJ48_9GAMM
MPGERIFRGFLGFLVTPAIAAVAYALFAWGGELRLFVLPFTLAVAYGLTVVFMLPAFLLLTTKGWYSWWSAVAVPGIILGVFFLISSYFSYQDYGALESGGRVLAKDGALTTAGWLNLFVDSGIMAAIGCASGSIFYVIYGPVRRSCRVGAG